MRINGLFLYRYIDIQVNEDKIGTMVDKEEFLWGWFTGLVRRAATGILLFFLFAAVAILLVVAEKGREDSLSQLSHFSSEHARFTAAFIDIADHATDLAGSGKRASATSAIQPLRLSLLAARDQRTPRFQCAEIWADGLQRLQQVPASIIELCDSPDQQCQVNHANLLLDDLVNFEMGLASAQDALREIDRLCHGQNASDAVCSYYLTRDSDNEIEALGGFLGSHYQERRSSGSRRSSSGPQVCAASQTYLTLASRLVGEIDPTARPRTLADFERLGQTITEARVAVQAEDTRVSGAPAGGIFSVLIARDVSLPIVNLLALLAILYALLQVRRLGRLVSSAPLSGTNSLYGLYPGASSTFTSPVFSGSGHFADMVTREKLSSRISGRLIGLMFDHIPTVALLLSVIGVLGVSILRGFGSNQFSYFGISISWIIVVLQIVATRAYVGEQKEIRSRFAGWVDAPLEQQPASEGDA